jgi:hypothetical protein
MPFLSGLYGKLLGIGSAILAGLLAFFYLRNKHITQGRREELVKYTRNSYEALKSGNKAERDFKGSINDKEEIVEGVYLRGDDFVWVSESPSSGSK